jgi:uncharacterized protein YecE (DUF72 family)
MTVYVGTSGWYYPKGKGKWDDLFYPPDLASRDELSYYAERFNAVEINKSFYGPITPSEARSWVERTPPDFRFCAKLYQKFTHPKMYREASGKEDAPSDPDFERVKRGLEPLAGSGKLGALLAQFPPSFKADDTTLGYLEDLIRRLEAYPLAVELRHRSWSESIQARNLLEEYGVAWVMIDEPKFRTSIRDVPLTSKLGYFRFHGRNYEQWWKGNGEERYNYLYSAPEQAELASEVEEVANHTAETFAFYNNHYKAKAVVNALQLKSDLRQPISAPLTEEMLQEYPNLKEIVGVATGGR